jgi:UDP-GlcNAc:undecaprenyl-phosphate GlcNAc-1-phosphate transferase
MDINFLIIFSLIVAFLFSFASVPFVRVLAFKIGAIDVPKDARRMHSSPIPRIGGLAIYFGFLVSFFCFGTVIDEKMVGVLIGATLLILLGIFDDVKPIRALYKLIVQVVAASIPVIMGLRIAFLTNINIFSGDASLNLGFLAIPVTIIWIVGLTNALNLIDGLDGLAAGVTTISAICLMIVALFNNRYEMLLPLSAIAGATIGFLPYNLNPAKIFMGDTGALFLGYILATLSIDGFFKSYAAITFIIPLIVLGLPLFDTSFAIIRRAVKGKPIMAPDRSHLHHRLVDAGFTQRQTVGILCAISGLLSLAAIVLVTKGVNRMIFMLVASTAFYYGGKFYIKNKNYEQEFLKKIDEDIGTDDE